MAEEVKQLNNTQGNTETGIATAETNIYEKMERSEILAQERENAKQYMLSNKGSISAIQQYMTATDNHIAQLKAEKRLLAKQADDNKEMWVKSNTFSQDQARKIDFLEQQVKESQQGQLQGVSANQVINEKSFAEHSQKEALKKRLSSHFRTSLKNDEW